MPRIRPAFAPILAALIAVTGLAWSARTPAYAASASFRPAPIALSSPDVHAPLRGLYDYSLNQEAPVGSYDTYIRYNWRDLEPSEGVYNFALIDARLAEARATGKRHGFRVRAMISGSGVIVPDYIKARMALGWWADSDGNGSNDTYVPDWNDPDFLSGFERLMAALGNRYRRHPDLSFIDIGGYGNWGEWHVSGFSDPTSGAQRASFTSLARIIDAHTSAFNPDDRYGPRLVMMSDNADALRYAFEKSRRIGWRRDSLGYSLFTSGGGFRQSWDEPLRAKLMAERWKTAPVITEFYSPTLPVPDAYRLAQQQVRDYHVSLVGNGNTKAWDSMDATSRQALLDVGKAAGFRFELDELALGGTFAPGGSLSITHRWENSGSAPAYEPWQAYVQLRASGRVVLEAPLYVDFETLLPTNGTPVSVTDALVLPSRLGGGVYDVHVQVRDLRGYRKPLPLAIAGRLSDGSYKLGQITLTGATVSVPPVQLPALSCTTRQFNGDGSGRYGQVIEGATYAAGTIVTLAGQSSTSVRGMVVDARDNRAELAAPGASYTMLTRGAYTIGFYSLNTNLGTQWVKLQICTPPSPTVAPTATYTPFPVAPPATRTPTPTISPCAVVRHTGDGTGKYGNTTWHTYRAGTTITLVARSSAAVRGIAWITGQTPLFLDNVGSKATLGTESYWDVGFESSTRNLTSEWVDIRLCPPGVSGPAVTQSPTPAPVACETRRLYGDGSDSKGQTTQRTYSSGTVFTLTARSSSAVWAFYRAEGQADRTLTSVGASYTAPATASYVLGFQSSTANRSTEWVDVRACGTSIAGSLDPDEIVARLYLPALIGGGAGLGDDSPPAGDTAEATPTSTATGAPTGEPSPTGTAEPSPTGTATAAAPTSTATEEPSPTGTAEPSPTGTAEPSPTGGATEETGPTSTPTSTAQTAP